MPRYDLFDALVKQGRADKHELTQRLSSSMEALNARIAGLAFAWHVPPDGLGLDGIF
jgi:hypothetical protein